MDLVMFPVDPRLGLEYMLGAKQFVDRFRVGMFVPMHFDEEYVLCQCFSRICGRSGRAFRGIDLQGRRG